MASLCEDLLAGREKGFERPDGFGGTGDGQTVNPAKPRAQFSV